MTVPSTENVTNQGDMKINLGDNIIVEQEEKAMAENIELSEDDQKEADKLEAQIQYHAARGNDKEVEKIKKEISKLWGETRKEVFDSMK